MSRKEQFLWVVQTGCLTRAIKDNWDISFPIRIMASATRVPEEAIPEDIDSAAFEFLQWQFKYGSEEDQTAPEWLQSYLEANVEDTA